MGRNATPGDVDQAGHGDRVAHAAQAQQLSAPEWLGVGDARIGQIERTLFGEIRDRSFEHQRYRASGLNLVVAAIVLWNNVYLERAVQALKSGGQTIDRALLSHLSPLGWEHSNLTGDYVWKPHKKAETGAFRPLRRVSKRAR